MGKRKSVKKSHLKLTGDNYIEKVLGGVNGNQFENRDCTVKALMHATDVPYWEAHRWLAKKGRRMRTGAPVQSIIKGGKVIFGHRFGKKITPKKTVGKFIKEHPEGTFYMVVTHHAFCIKDGQVKGFVHSLNQHIECYWRVTKIERPDPVESTTMQFVEQAADHEADELERWENRK